MAKKRRTFPNIPERIAGLEEIAENLWWSWHPEARMLFKMLDRQIWKECTHNPDKMLRELPTAVLQAASRNKDYLRHYDLVLSQFREYIEFKPCALFDENCHDGFPVIAYFSAEYGLHHSLPFYAGGLGFLAGDFIKECSDINVPIVAIGFMYPEGYVSQRMSESGWQENVQQRFNREEASINPVLDADGKSLLVRVPLIDPPLYVAVWKVVVGQVSLYLLDTDIDENDPWNRGITARLYTGDMEMRLRQEIVLGIGGAEVLEQIGIKHSAVHLNEGHAAFCLLERIRDGILEGLSMEDSLQKVQAKTIFTTHTPVPAGHDVFSFYLMEKYFAPYWNSLGLDRETFLQWGTHPDEPERGFNMTAFALRMSRFKNAVSRRHAEVANSMWQCLWLDSSKNNKKIGFVTNGIHVPTWIEPKMKLLFNRYLHTDWLDSHDNTYLWELIEEIPDEELWHTHCWLKIKLLDIIRERSRQKWTAERGHPFQVLTGGALFDHTVLTIGFARRFATYKRADLILHDTERLIKLLKDRWRPIQIIFAGKAHPADDPGKMVLQRIFNACQDPAFCGRIAFVEDYGEQFAQYMVHGVDVWLNNPLPPMEACGTSGMKAALNGVPNLSILDGWWLEGYDGENGWAIKAETDGDDRTAADANAIYDLLEEKIIPLYYDVSGNGIPHGWVRVMKNAIKSCGAGFSARRMVKEYVKKFYAKAIKN